MRRVVSEAGAAGGTRGAHVPARHTRRRRSGRARRAAGAARQRSAAPAGEERSEPHAPACDHSGSMRLPLLPLLVLPLVLVRPAAGETSFIYERASVGEEALRELSATGALDDYN